MMTGSIGLEGKLIRIECIYSYGRLTYGVLTLMVPDDCLNDATMSSILRHYNCEAEPLALAAFT
jgi:hypothetical protein